MDTDSEWTSGLWTGRAGKPDSRLLLCWYPSPWGTGTLFDSMSIPDGHFALQNRGSDGSGQGWSAANDVLWNCRSKNYLVENPPTAHNWAFGCQGANQTGSEPQGIIVSPGQAVQPASLYVEQLRERLNNPSLNP